MGSGMAPYQEMTSPLKFEASQKYSCCKKETLISTFVQRTTSSLQEAITL